MVILLLACTQVEISHAVISYLDVDTAGARDAFKRFEVRLASALKQHAVAMQFVSISNEPQQQLNTLQRVIAEKPQLIVANSGTIARAVRNLSGDIPVVFYVVADPVRIGIIGNRGIKQETFTGFSADDGAEGKSLEILISVVKSARVVGVFDDQHGIASSGRRQRAERAAKQLGVTLRWMQADSIAEFERAVRVNVESVDGWYVPDIAAPYHDPAKVIHIIERTGKPAMYARQRMVEAGGLMAYCADLLEDEDALVDLVKSILAGQSLANLPVRRPEKFRLVLNSSAAQNLKIRFPNRLLLLAVQVIR